ncbi:MAG: hypothetical protein LBN30_08880 [Oscillospiraceae bacterium]|nr:hypothetical protein [Oscillospiraceae bacterium]
MTNSYATGDVTGTFYLGGFMGNTTGTASNNFSTGTVTSIETDREPYIGGFAGSGYAPQLESNYYFGEFSTSFGTVVAAEDLADFYAKLAETTGWDFDTLWTIGDDGVIGLKDVKIQVPPPPIPEPEPEPEPSPEPSPEPEPTEPSVSVPYAPPASSVRSTVTETVAAVEETEIAEAIQAVESEQAAIISEMSETATNIETTTVAAAPIAPPPIADAPEEIPEIIVSAPSVPLADAPQPAPRTSARPSTPVAIAPPIAVAEEPDDALTVPEEAPSEPEAPNEPAQAPVAPITEEEQVAPALIVPIDRTTVKQNSGVIIAVVAGAIVLVGGAAIVVSRRKKAGKGA